MIRIGLLGYSGRMGQLIAEEIGARKDCVMAGGAARHTALKSPPPLGGGLGGGSATGTEADIFGQDPPPDNVPEAKYGSASPPPKGGEWHCANLIGQCSEKPQGGEPLFSVDAAEVIAVSDVVIDFTSAEVTPTHARLAAEQGKAFMSGTTGLSAEGIETLKQASQQIPVLYAPNTSLSLAATKQIVTLAAKLLGGFDYDIAILDEHHRMKKDAPSGTAKALGEAVLAGNNAERQPSYATIRSGHIVGEHEVIFAGEGETIRIHHSVADRRIFARGALQAALWLHRKPKGFYKMDDVLGLNTPLS